ncbi:hypothetical protein T484DRAFT_2288051 [Baffinella frigidus]|nr:hypothetical protein T484DRAFT_2288051 [Cryptophyta sp. CCMP2293]
MLPHKKGSDPHSIVLQVLGLCILPTYADTSPFRSGACTCQCRAAFTACRTPRQCRWESMLRGWEYDAKLASAQRRWAREQHCSQLARCYPRGGRVQGLPPSDHAHATAKPTHLRATLERRDWPD